MVLVALLGCGAPPVVDAAPTTRLTPPRLYGVWGLNGFVDPEGFAEVRRRIGIEVFQVASEDPAWTVRVLLPSVRDAGLRVTLRLTGDHERYTTLGSFDRGAWTAELDRWAGAGLQPFVDDGTLVGHMLLDDVTNFPVVDPSAADFDAMARASKDRFPGLMTYVRQQARRLPTPASGRYRHLDAQVNQYEVSEGPVDRYISENGAAAGRLGLAVIHGINIADGGDGSSGQPGWRSGHWAMSAEEIRRYGTALAEDPACTMLLAWEYDGRERWSDGTVGADYFQRPELEAALRELGQRHRADRRP